MILAPPLACGKDREFGLGAVFGEPTGITGKFWSNGKNAVDGGLSYSFKGKDFFLVYADKLWHFPHAFHDDNEFIRELSPYLGAGSGFYFGNEFRLNIRIPLGIEWLPESTPSIGVFVEAVPALRLVQETEADFGGGIGIRYYF